MLAIEHPPGYEPERDYVYNVIFREILGIDYTSRVGDCQVTSLSVLDGENQRKIILPDVFFQTPSEKWLTGNSFPNLPLEWWNTPVPLQDAKLVSPRLPILYGAHTRQSQLVNGFEIQLPIDVFGSAFFMLTNYEQYLNPARDRHNRFTAENSLAFQEGFLERPIVNEYVEIIRQSLKLLWPQMKTRERQSRIFLSHDVDQPYCKYEQGMFSLTKSLAADFLIRRDAYPAAKRLRSFFNYSEDRYQHDPNNTFDFIMRLSEKFGRQSSFYFMVEHTAGPLDGCSYSIDEPWIRNLLGTIHERGHEVGLHPSYHSYCSAEMVKRQFDALRTVAAEEGITKSHWGGRQHFLRYAAPTTWEIWAQVGLTYDSTMTFPDQVGFSSGICCEYTLFNVTERKPINLIERPLIAGEHTLLSYLSLDFDACVNKIVNLNNTCKLFNGDFSLLWHNNNLITRAQQQCYRLICESLS